MTRVSAWTADGGLPRVAGDYADYVDALRAVAAAKADPVVDLVEVRTDRTDIGPAVRRWRRLASGAWGDE